MSQAGVALWSEAKPVEMVPGLIRRTLSETDDMMVVEARAVAGTVVPMHSHPNQQITYVVSGQLELTMNGTLHTCHPGDSVAVPGNVDHTAHFPFDTVVVDSFSPPRPEYR